MMPRPRCPSLPLIAAMVVLALNVQLSSAAKLEFASPLQSLTIPDPVVAADPAPTPRSRFLSRFRAGLTAEGKMRQKMEDQRKASLQAQAVSSKKSPRREMMENRIAERAFDAAAKQAEEEMESKRSEAIDQAPSSQNKYQFVGVIDRSKHRRNQSENPISWYARPKPADAKWSVRLVHVNRDAIVYDLMRRGKVDVTCEYKNTGKRVSEETKVPIIQNDYKIKPRTWKNAWNFSPKHFFTDSSGAFWRERRLRPGLYTDGATVYETSYRYRDGRNGMHRRSTLDQYLNSKRVDEKTKDKILERLDSDSPDVVLEDL